MRILKIKNQEDCFDGSIMKDVLLDEPITESFIYFWEKRGKLEYFPSFARPFFKVEIKGHFYIKGIKGNSSLSLILYKAHPEKSINVFHHFIKEFSTC